MPWPQLPVAARAPAAPAPSAMLTASISVSAFMHTPSTAGMSRAMASSRSVNGSIGYPAKNRQPASMAARATASLPCSSRAGIRSPPGCRT